MGFNALEEALKRVGEASPESRFAPLAESLLWIDILNSAFFKENKGRFSKTRANDTDGKIIEGLRYARHRLVHDIKVYGLHGVIYYGGDFNADDFDHKDFNVGTPLWTWRDISKLAEAHHKKGEDIYVAHLQGKEVEPTLNSAARFLANYHKV